MRMKFTRFYSRIKGFCLAGFFIPDIRVSAHDHHVMGSEFEENASGLCEHLDASSLQCYCPPLFRTSRRTLCIMESRDGDPRERFFWTHYHVIAIYPIDSQYALLRHRRLAFPDNGVTAEKRSMFGAL